MARRAEIDLDLELVVAAAFELLEAEGLDALTMRKLAERLSVRASALYWHVADKSELLGIMGRSIYEEARSAVPPATHWWEWLIGFGSALRRRLTAQRDAARLYAVARLPYDDDPDARVRIAAGPLIDLGLGRADAMTFQASILSLAVGWSSFEENPSLREFLSGLMDFDESYEIALASLVDGFRRKIDRQNQIG
jgi:TetR/AcrR family tetracycline transcriptional repressor